MGLSNQEREQKIFFSVWRLSKDSTISVIKRLDPKLAELLESLWPTMLGKSSNGLYWLLGSGADNGHMDNPGLFQIAVIGNLAQARQRTEENAEYAAEQAALKAIKDPVKRREETTRFGYLNYMPELTSIEKILQRTSPALAAVYEVHEDCQHILYAVHRYEDDISKKYEGLIAVLGAILGRCFSLFTENDAVRKAYYLSQLSGRVLENQHEDSLVLRWWKDLSLHCTISIGAFPDEALHEKFAEIQLKQTLTTEERLLLTLWLCYRYRDDNRCLSYLPGAIKKHNKGRTDRVSLKKIMKACKSYTPLERQEGRAHSTKFSNFCWLTKQIIERDYSGKKQVKKR